MSILYLTNFQCLEGYSWPEDREHCEEQGRMLLADPSKVTKRAKKRGISQLGTLGEPDTTFLINCTCAPMHLTFNVLLPIN